MIKVKDLIALFERMLREHWAYEWGAAREGVVDCSGAFVWAYRQFGESIYHGSNTMARQDVGELRPVSEAMPGWAVFKVRAWDSSESGNRWHGDAPGDIYHVGLLGEDGKVLNAQSTKTGFVASTLDGWDYAAPLDAVDYTDEEGKEMEAYRAEVRLKNEDSYLNVRNAPAGDVIGKLFHGQRVTVQVVKDGWAYVSYGDSGSGYVAARYLERVEDAQDEAEIAADAVIQTIITDEAGNTFRPVGDWSVRVEVEITND